VVFVSRSKHSLGLSRMMANRLFFLEELFRFTSRTVTGDFAFKSSF
jgi:hypothetical protein